MSNNRSALIISGILGCSMVIITIIVTILYFSSTNASVVTTTPSLSNARQDREKGGIKSKTESSKNGGGTGPSGLSEMRHDDDRSAAVVLGDFGIAPWGSASNFVDRDAKWIWSSDGATKFADNKLYKFHYTFTNTTSKPIDAKIHTLLDNNGELFVNLISLGNVSGGWGGGYKIKSATFLPGTNYIHIVARNVGGPAGLLLSALDETGKVLFHTNSKWKWSFLTKPFSYFNDVDLPGFDIKQYSNVQSQRHCEDHCLIDRCQVFHFNANTRKCYTKKGTTDANTITGFKRNDNSFKTYGNTDYNGFEYKVLPNITSADSCKSICEEDIACKFYTWGKDKTCRLKKYKTGASDNVYQGVPNFI